MKDWLFVGGIPRSGTTLMCKLLSLHPHALITDETHLQLSLLWGLTLPPARASLATFAFDGCSSPYVPWRLPCLKDYDDPLDIVRAMADGYFEQLHPQVTLCGDKSPVLGGKHPDGSGRRIWEDLRLLYPSCRFLFMERPVADCVTSMLKKFPDHPLWADTDVIADRLDGLRLCDDAYWVSLAELNERPQTKLVEVLEWAGLEPGLYPWQQAAPYFEPGHRVW